MVKKIRRPMPPASMLDAESPYLCLAPAHGVGDWIQENILAADGLIHNGEHAHLIDADIAFLWASGGFSKQGRFVIGQAEEVMFRAGGWQKARQEQQMREWFGRVPSYLITFDASFCATCSDIDWCALVEHELFHIGQKRNAFGFPEFTKDGKPKLCIRSHDVEEFVGVVKRYGAGDPNSAVNRMARAAMAKPTVSRANIAASCGTCHLKVA